MPTEDHSFLQASRDQFVLIIARQGDDDDSVHVMFLMMAMVMMLLRMVMVANAMASITKTVIQEAVSSLRRFPLLQAAINKAGLSVKPRLEEGDVKLEPQVRCNIMAFAGLRDEFVRPAEVQQWSAVMAAEFSFELKELDADHGFMERIASHIHTPLPTLGGQGHERWPKPAAW